MAFGVLQALPMTSTFSQEAAARANKTNPAGARLSAALVLGMCSVVSIAALNAQQAPSSPPGAAQTPVTSLTCTSKPGERTQCPADTSAGVVLLRSMGDAPCLLGRTWGYDQTSVWVQDGCSAEFGTRLVPEQEPTQAQGTPRTITERFGFLLFLIGDKRRRVVLHGFSATGGI